jgi:hypothetical protein
LATINLAEALAQSLQKMVRIFELRADRENAQTPLAGSQRDPG